MSDAAPASPPSRAIGPLFALFPFLRPYAGRWALAFLALVTSAGATLAAALEVARNAPDGSVLLTMLPDTGERYLSTFLFEGVNEGSDEIA